MRNTEKVKGAGMSLLYQLKGFEVAGLRVEGYVKQGGILRFCDIWQSGHPFKPGKVGFILDFGTQGAAHNSKGPCTQTEYSFALI